MATQAFLWGRAGEKLTPAQVEKERAAADLLAKGAMDYSPVAHWSQGLNRVAQGLLAGIDYRRADNADADIASRNKELIANALSGGAPPASTAIPMTGAAGEVSATTPASQPIDLTGNEVYSGFMDTVKGGVTNPYGLAAIAATGQRESQFSPGNVNRTWSDPSQSGQPGTAGGIMSWRGPRYDALAATGDLSPQGQAKFFLQENPQLIQALNNASSVEEAQTLMNNAWAFAGYDKPGGETAKRLAAAQGFLPTFQGAAQAPVEVASLDPSVGAASPAVAAIEEQAPGGMGAPLTDQSFDDRFGPTPLPVDARVGRDSVAAALTETNASGAVPQQLADVPTPSPAQRSPIGQQQTVSTPQPAPAVQQVAQAQTSINPAIIEALSDPQATPQTRAIASALLQQQQGQQEQAAQQQQWMERQRYEQQQKDADPLRRQQLEMGQLEIDEARQPKRQPLINAGNGNVYDPNTKSWLQSPNLAPEKTPDSVRALEIRAERAGLKAGTPEYNQFMLSGGSGGTSLSVGPNGEVNFSQGGGGKSLTEAQGKDAFFATRMTAATPTLDKYEGSLLSLGGAASSAIPMNLGNYLQSDEYQLAKDAGNDFVKAYLRKDSGAALTPYEEKEYGELLLPQPGDGKVRVEAKRLRRQVAAEALKNNLPQSAIDNLVKTIKETGADKAPDVVPTDIPGVIIRKKSGSSSPEMPNATIGKSAR